MGGTITELRFDSMQQLEIYKISPQLPDTLKARPVAHSVGTRECFPKVKEGGAKKLTPQPDLTIELKNELSHIKHLPTQHVKGQI
jgi:hypothetical protein